MIEIVRGMIVGKEKGVKCRGLGDKEKLVKEVEN